MQNYGSRVAGGASLVIVEATAVSPEGRITHGGLGLWHDGQIEPLREIAGFVKSLGALPGFRSPTSAARPMPTGRGRATTMSRRATRLPGRSLVLLQRPSAAGCPARLVQ
jgi:hypothetical protein